VHVWKAGAVVKIDLAAHEAIEIVGRDLREGTQPSGAPGGQKRGTVETRMGEDSWQRLRSRRKTVSDMRGHAREDSRVSRIRRLLSTLDTTPMPTPSI
jgi:hypothetical protein